ncbi:hypothetical protein V1517DRAFT_311698 [Lipomyces orientalis]|uniref:Uncharacterized protein n=1 Tax=Lipomyces orientalis TaxID=1233043 RepID=A0ACC3U098_9ASCO
MSKYWCKPCKTFVLDTKLGRSQHEASVRHKSSMDRTLRDLHRQKAQSERNERDAKRILAGIERSVGASSSKQVSTTASKPGIGTSRPTAPTVGSVSLSKSSPVSAPATYNPGPSTSKHAGPTGSRPLGGSQAKTTSSLNKITKPGSRGSGYSSGQLFSNGSKNAIRR